MDQPAIVIDGDTVRIGGERVRIRNIDAPELGCPGARAAADRLRRLLMSGRVEIVRCTGRERCLDPYRRTLARIEVNGRDVGEILIAEGLATRWPRRASCG